MNSDQIKGKVDQATGKLKQKIGEAVNDHEMANRGVADQVKGAAKETWGNAKEAAAHDADNRNREKDAESTRTRDSIANKAQDLKNRISDKIDEHKNDEHKKSA